MGMHAGNILRHKGHT